MGRYFDELKRTMEWLASQPNTIFLGQAVGCAGTFMHGTISDVPAAKRIEMPVSEQFQMQVTIGLALDGQRPISIYPRQNFLLLAAGELSNVLDKMEDISSGKVIPPVIIRTAAGTTRPIHPGHQHVGNFAETFRALLKHVDVIELHDPDEIFPAYRKVYESKKPTILIEFGDYYGEK